jgi:hypothetical protein
LPQIVVFAHQMDRLPMSPGVLIRIFKECPLGWKSITWNINEVTAKWFGFLHGPNEYKFRCKLSIYWTYDDDDRVAESFVKYSEIQDSRETYNVDPETKKTIGHEPPTSTKKKYRHVYHDNGLLYHRLMEIAIELLNSNLTDSRFLSALDEHEVKRVPSTA